jgi:hypothetical protein
MTASSVLAASQRTQRRVSVRHATIVSAIDSIPTTLAMRRCVCS